MHSRRSRIALLAALLALVPAGAAVVSPELFTDPPVMTFVAGDQLNSAIAYDGANFLVVWSASNDLFATRVGPDGKSLDHGILRLSSYTQTESVPAVAFDGTNYLVVWQDTRDRSTSFNIYGARISKSGDVLDPFGFPIHQSAGNPNNFSPEVAFDGTNYLVVWREQITALPASQTIYGKRVSPSKTVLDPTAIRFSNGGTDAQNPSVSANSQGFLVVWDDGRNGPRDILGARLLPDGTLVDATPFVISSAANAQTQPQTASGGGGHFVVWADGQGGGANELYGATVPSAGAVTTTPLKLSNETGVGSPVLAFDGTNFLVAYMAAQDLKSVRVSAAAPALDATPSTVSNALGTQSAPAAAFGGATFLVTYQDNRQSAQDIYSTRVASDGTVAAPLGVPLSQHPNFEYAPAVAFDGANFLVVWEDSRNGVDQDIYGARFSQAGVMLTSPAVALATGFGNQSRPALAFDGANFLLVWEEAGAEVRGALISPAGPLSAGTSFLICDAANRQGTPDVAASSSGFLVVWEDSRSGNSDIYGARVSPTGTVLDPNGFVIASTPQGQVAAQVATDGTDYGVTWVDSRNQSSSASDIYGARVSSAGVLLDPAGFRLSYASSYDEYPTIEWGGTGYLVAWRYLGQSFYDVQGVRFFSDGGVEPFSQPISTASSDQIRADLAFDGRNFIAVWSDDRHITDTSKLSYPDIYAARVRPNGSRIDTAGVQIAYSPSYTEDQPAIARGSGKAMLIVYVKAPSPNSIGYGRLRLRAATFNDAPVAQDKAVAVSLNTAAAVDVTASDLDVDPLSYAIVAAPANGNLTGTAPALTYVPNTGYTGVDTFTYKANDGTIDSNTATVTLTVTRPNTTPVANAQTVNATEDTPSQLVLTGSDADSDPLTYAVVSQPTKGVLTGTAPALTYTPNANVTGGDFFTFRVNDGTADSATATVSINIAAVNDAPVATSASGTTPEDTSLALTLTATDAENQSLTYSATATNGSLSGNGSAFWTFNPTPNFAGTATVTFTATDGAATSQPATVTITVTPVNDPPVATAQSVQLSQGATAQVTLAGTDVDGDTLSYAVVTQPASGTLSGTAPSLTYTPAAAFRGNTTFTFKVNDGTVDSPTATVDITVANVAPVASVAVEPPSPVAGGSVLITGTASDVGGDVLSFELDFGDGSPVVTTASATHTYATAGSFTVTFKASDGAATTTATATAQVSEAGGTGGGAGGGAGGGSGGAGGGTSAGGGAGGGTEEEPATSQGCGCGASGAAPMLLLGIVGVIRRRRSAAVSSSEVEG